MKQSNCPPPAVNGLPVDEQLTQQILDQNPVLFSKITASLNCEQDDVSVAIREVVRFLFLVADYPSGKLTPSNRVDLAWHEFILCTKAYWEFCDATFGRTIHHYPGGSDHNNQSQFAETLRLYKTRFGIPNPFFWGTGNQDAPECGACESI